MTMLKCPVTDYTVFLESTKIPSLFKELISFCLKEYDYKYIGHGKPINVSTSVSFSLYFSDPSGKLHALPYNSYLGSGDRNFWANFQNRKPLFAW